MTKKINQSDTSPAHPSRKAQVETNPAGAARRRLLRAVAGSGSVMLGGLFSSGWQKPVVNAVILPAHAQLSGDIAPACAVTLSATVVANVWPYTAQLFMSNFSGGTLVAETNGGTGSTILSGVTVPTAGTYTVYLYYSASFQPWSFTLSQACCGDAQATNTNFDSNTTTYFANLSFTTPGDGTCTVL